jgi:acetoacetyl-CoA synthetase
MAKTSVMRGALAEGHGSALDAADQPLFTPSPETIAASQLTAFTRALEARTGRQFADHAALERFCIAENRTFWGALLDWLDLPLEGAAEPVLTSDDIETAAFFPDLRLNYAEVLLRGNEADPAVISVRAGRAPLTLSRGALRDRVLRLAGGLQALGLRPGDGVAAVLRNDAEAVIAALAVAACGGLIATAAPDMGAEMLADRLADLAPRFLMTVLEPRSWDPGPTVAERAAALIDRLPSLEAVIALDDGPAPATALPLYRAADLADAAPAELVRLPFNQPLFVLFSSGTTGPAKGFVHGAGGTLLEHLKEHRLHGDMGPVDRMFFQTSPAWMMWHWQLSSLACGGAVVLFDGVVEGADTLWRIVAEQRATVFGTSPPYLKLCQSLGFAPGEALELSALRAVLSTGSILQPDQARWVCDQVRPLPVQSVSGGSDMIGCFVLGNPNLPTWPGEAQCRSLGLDVRASEGEGGELICANPFPSRPPRLLADPDGARFHRAYFSQRPGVWSHGDLIGVTPRGGVILRGRLDGVLNIRGVRVGPAEVYAALAEIPQVQQALAVEQAGAEPGDERMVLLVVMAPGQALDATLSATIRRTLTRRASAAHAPERILAVAELPTTHSGKLSEAAAGDVVNGRPVRNRSALRNPGSLDLLAEALAARKDGEAQATVEATGEASVGGTEAWLTGLWNDLLPTPPSSPDDNFFELGGHSLMAARMLAEVRRRTGRNLPMATLIHAPTVRRLAVVIDDPDWRGASRLVPLKAGVGDPFFMVHSMTGNVLQLHSLIRALDIRRPIHGLQARGLDADEAPLDTVEAMAEDYLAAIRAVQPAGPYSLGGFSFGGLVAYEMARRLELAGETVAVLILLDSQVDKRFLPPVETMKLLGTRLAHHAGRLRALAGGGAVAYLRDRLKALAGHRPPPPPPEHDFPPRLQAIRDGILKATTTYRPGRYNGPLLFIRPAVKAPVSFDPTAPFRVLARRGLEIRQTPGDHDTMIEPPHVQALAGLLAGRIG